MRCALVDVGFKRGVMDTRTIVFDTTDTIIEATGQADFAREQLDMRVKPVPKDFSLLTLRVPFDVRGSFQQPQITPDKASADRARRRRAAARLDHADRRAARVDRDRPRRGQRLRGAHRARQVRRRAGEERSPAPSAPGLEQAEADQNKK